MRKSEVIKKTKDFLRANKLQSEVYALMGKAHEVRSVGVDLNDLIGATVTVTMEEKCKKGFRTKKYTLKPEEIFE